MLGLCILVIRLVPQAWFMEGKEGKEYKANSLHQIMRRLGFFPTMRSSRAGISILGTEKRILRFAMLNAAELLRAQCFEGWRSARECL